jgi:Zn-dependent protease
MRRFLPPITLAASFAAFAWQWNVGSASVFCLVLALHEAGHALAMRHFGYRNVRVYFVPFLGALTTCDPVPLSVRRQVAIYLAGPIPGLCVAAAIVLLAPPAAHHEPGRSIVRGLVVINGINLLPFFPLDGGRVVELLFTDNRRRQKLLQWSSAVGLMGLAIGLHDSVLGIVAAVLALSRIQWSRLIHSVSAGARFSTRMTSAMPGARQGAPLD